MDDFKENKNYPLHMYFAENFTYVELADDVKSLLKGKFDIKSWFVDDYYDWVAEMQKLEVAWTILK